MKIQPQVTLRNIPHSDALEAQVLKKIEKLESFYHNIMRCDVVVEQMQKHNHQGRLYQVKILLSVPNKKLTINHGGDVDPYVALRDAFNAARRQLLSYAQQRRGDVKTHPLRLHGRVVRLFPMQGFGFVVCNGNEYYFSDANMTNHDFDRLEVGSEVAFIESIPPGGQPQANRVTVHRERDRAH